MKRFLRRHGLSLILLWITLKMLVVLLIMGPKEWRWERQLPADAPVTGDFWHWWAFQLVLSLIADVFGFLLIVALKARLFETGSPEAEDPPEDADPRGGDADDGERGGQR